jgi:hypothetical protein
MEGPSQAPPSRRVTGLGLCTAPDGGASAGRGPRGPGARAHRHRASLTLPNYQAACQRRAGGRQVPAVTAARRLRRHPTLPAGAAPAVCIFPACHTPHAVGSEHSLSSRSARGLTEPLCAPWSGLVLQRTEAHPPQPISPELGSLKGDL